MNPHLLLVGFCAGTSHFRPFKLPARPSRSESAQTSACEAPAFGLMVFAPPQTKHSLVSPCSTARRQQEKTQGHWASEKASSRAERANILTTSRVRFFMFGLVAKSCHRCCRCCRCCCCCWPEMTVIRSGWHARRGNDEPSSSSNTFTVDSAGK